MTALSLQRASSTIWVASCLVAGCAVGTATKLGESKGAFSSNDAGAPSDAGPYAKLDSGRGGRQIKDAGALRFPEAEPPLSPAPEASVVAPPPPCPRNCKCEPHGDRQFAFCAFAVAWTNASAECDGYAAALARPADEVENGWLKSRARSLGLSEVRWLGGSDVTAEGSWLWPDGTLFWSGSGTGSAFDGAYTAWNVGMPDNGSEADCLAMTAAGGWDDLPCSETHSFVCERAAP